MSEFKPVKVPITKREWIAAAIVAVVAWFPLSLFFYFTYLGPSLQLWMP